MYNYASTICDLIFEKLRKIILIECLHLISHHSAISYWKLMEFGIQKELLLSFLDTKYHFLSVQNGGMVSVSI